MKPRKSVVRVLLIVAAALVFTSAAPLAPATTWKTLGVRELVYSYADLIVSGTIVRQEAERVDGKRVGVIAVTEVIYGLADLKEARVVMDSADHGNRFAVGDAGVWFLASASSPPPRRLVERPRPPKPGSGLDSELFTANHPSTYWAARGRGEDGKANRELAEVRQLARSRLEADIKALLEALAFARRKVLQ